MLVFSDYIIDRLKEIFGDLFIESCPLMEGKDSRVEDGGASETTPSKTCAHPTITAPDLYPKEVVAGNPVTVTAVISGNEQASCSTHVQFADVNGRYLDMDVDPNYWSEMSVSGARLDLTRTINAPGKRKARIVTHCRDCGAFLNGREFEFTVKPNCDAFPARLKEFQSNGGGATGHATIEFYRMVQSCHDVEGKLITVSSWGSTSTKSIRLELMSERTFDIGGKSIELGAFQARTSDGKAFYEAKPVQCVSLIKEYYHQITGNTLSPAGDGHEVYAKLADKFAVDPNYRYTRFDAGTDNATSPPATGDVISFDGSKYGHVAIVDWIEDVPGKEDEKIVHLFEQNSGGRQRAFKMTRNEKGAWSGALKPGSSVTGWGRIEARSSP